MAGLAVEGDSVGLWLVGFRLEGAWLTGDLLGLKEIGLAVSGDSVGLWLVGLRLEGA